MNLNLLHELWSFMTTEDLPKERKWSFVKVNNYDQANGWSCGTVGCAMGELPLIFPDDFIWKGGGIISKRYGGVVDFHAVEKFFGLTYVEAKHIFDAQQDFDEYPDAVRLNYETSTRADVARNLKRFINAQPAEES